MDPTLDGSEKRRSARQEAPRVMVRIPSVDRFRTHYLKDISDGGLFVKSKKVLPVGSGICLEFWPPGWSAPVELSANVVRSVDSDEAASSGATPGMAVRFVAVAPELEVRLRELVAQHEAALAAQSPSGKSSVGDQVAGLVAELERSREAVGALADELAEKRGHVEALTEQSHRLEAELAELADSKSALAQALEAERAHSVAEQEKLRGLVRIAEARAEEGLRQVEEAQGELSETRRRLGELQAQGERVRQQVAESGRQLDDARMEAAGLRTELLEAGRELEKEREAAKAQEQRAARFSADLEERDLLEQSLRGLLSKVRGPRGAPSPGSLRSVSEEDEVRVETHVGRVENLKGAGGSQSMAEAAARSEPPEGAGLDLDLDDLLEGLEVAPGQAGDVGGASHAVDAEVAPSVEFEAEFVPVGSSPSFQAFCAALGPRTRILPAEALRDHQPVTEEGALVTDLIGASPTLITLLHQVEQRIPEARLREILYELQAKGLIELR